MAVQVDAEAIKVYKDKAKVQEIGKDVAGNSRYMIYITGICREAEFKKGDILMVSVTKIGYKAPRCNNPNLFGSDIMNNKLRSIRNDKVDKKVEAIKAALPPAEDLSKIKSQEDYGEDIIR